MSLVYHCRPSNGWRIRSYPVRQLLVIAESFMGFKAVQILDGKSCSEQIRREIGEQVRQSRDAGCRAPHLAAVLVGDDGASETYVANKVRDCDEVGFDSTVVRLDAVTSEDELLRKVAELNANDEIDGLHRAIAAAESH